MMDALTVICICSLAANLAQLLISCLIHKHLFELTEDMDLMKNQNRNVRTIQGKNELIPSQVKKKPFAHSYEKLWQREQDEHHS